MQRSFRKLGLVFNLKRVGGGTTVSFGIIVAAVFPVFYAVFLPTAAQTVINKLDILQPLWILLLILIFDNTGTYALSAIPTYLLRERHFLIQSLAHILSSSVASFLGYLLVYGDMMKTLPTLPGLEHPLVAGLYLFIPIMIIFYIGIRSMKRKKETQMH